MIEQGLVDALEKENFDLVAKCIELIEHIGWDNNGTYTFQDGDKWNKFNPNGRDQ